MSGSKSPVWMRLVQIRVVSLMCSQDAGRRSVAKLAVIGEPICRLLREAYRQEFITQNRKQQGNLSIGSLTEYWKTAVAGVAEDVARWADEGKVIGQNTPEVFQLFGMNYSLSALEWLAVSRYEVDLT